jgi:RNA polymerase sigma-70 factor (ECF subfamily)
MSQLFLLQYDGLRSHIRSRISAQLQGLVHAEDILQQTFVRAAQAIGTFQPRHAGSLRTWLQTIADNLIKDAEKRRRRERRAFPPPQQEPEGNASSLGDLVGKIACDSTSPGRRVHRRESVRCMLTAVSVLPTEQRDVIRRYYLQDQSLEQIAQATGRTKGAVRGICYRARKNLRTIMGRSSLYFSG